MYDKSANLVPALASRTVGAVDVGVFCGNVTDANPEKIVLGFVPFRLVGVAVLILIVSPSIPANTTQKSLLRVCLKPCFPRMIYSTKSPEKIHEFVAYCSRLAVLYRARNLKPDAALTVTPFAPVSVTCPVPA